MPTTVLVPLPSRQPKKLQTARPSSVREVNRAIVLNLIRLYRPISRVELSERTGIFRSNVSDIVDELVSANLVREERAVPSGRGRVPIHLYLNEESFPVLGISIRPHRTTVALSGLTGAIRKTVAFRTPRTPALFLDQVMEAIGTIRQYTNPAEGFHEFGISVPGLVDATSGVIQWIPALPAYTGASLTAELEQRTGTPTVSDNDCNLAALAELWLTNKERAGTRDYVFLDIGEVGVGAGLVLHQQVYRGHDNAFAAEFGHMIIDPNGPKCRCGRRGCWQAYVSDRATWARFDPESRFDATRFELFLDAAAAGDRRALAAVEETARMLSVGISNIGFTLNPELILVAGRVTRLWDRIGSIVESAFASPRIRVNVRPACASAEELFVQGAVTLALSKVFAQPDLGL